MPETQVEQDYGRFPAKEEAPAKTARTVAAEDTATSKPSPKGEVPEAKANTFTKEAGKLIGTAPQPQSAQQDINAILAPYINELLNLGPEYQQEMDFLKPYLTGGSGPQTFQSLVDTSKAQSSPTGNTAVNAADAAVGEAVANMKAPGFGALGTAGKQYENSLLYQEPEQAALNYQRYLQTYQGAGPNAQQLATWPTQEQQAYSAITGGNTTASGLPSVGNVPKTSSTPPPGSVNPNPGGP